MRWQNEKRRLKREAEDRAYEARMAEQGRKESLSMYDRINEANLSDDLKDILHRLANGERE